MNDLSTQILKITTDFLSRTGFGSEIEVEVKLEEDVYHIMLQTPSPALLIGYHGETLSALQLILGQHLHAATGQWLNLSLNVNDYRERRETALKSLADSAVSQVTASGQPHVLPPLPASERRVVHLYLTDHPQVTTTSQGIGRSRSVIISPK
ncbi:KH domain-containing protein [Candidatus Amesbacteria bacterium]|nr:KH domain-containing protein [Candidatus Amesbacteria bacterium]